MKNLALWVAEIKLETLPVLRRTALAVSYMAQNAENLSATDISDIVLHDPLMTLKVVGLANGRSRGRFSAEITTAQSAVIMLGVSPFFKHFAALNAIEDSMQEREEEMTGLLNCLSRAHHAAWQARDLATLRADVKAEEVYVGTLLHDMGEMVMWCVSPDLMLQILKTARREKVSREEAENSILGFTLWAFQQALAEAWKLPELLLTFMDNKNAGKPRALMAIIGAALARHAATGWHSPKLLADYEVIAGQFNFTIDEVVAIVHHNAITQGRHWDAFHVPPAAAWLPMLPGEWPEEQNEDDVPQQDAPSACLMPHADVLRRAMDEIAAHRDESLNLHDLISLVLEGMREGIGLSRVVFALATADGSGIRAKYMLGAEENSQLRDFQFYMKAPHLFARLMSKMQSVWVNAANQAAFAPLIPDRLSEIIGGREGFFAMSVFVRDKPVGMFYADKKHTGCELDEHSYQDFKRLCMSAAQALGHLNRS